MPDAPGVSPPLDPLVVARLACPACLGKLCLEDARLLCGNCGRAYPILDGIPVLIAAGDELPQN